MPLLFCSGGAIYSRSDDLTITGSTFKGNSAAGTGNTSGGGAVYVGSGNTEISDTTFGGSADGEGNTANRGGALYTGSGTVTVTDSTFTANKANTYGGAVFNAADGTTNISATDGKQTTFSGNSAATYGGAIYNAGTMNINTPPVPGAKVVFDSNTAGQNGTGRGGAIANVGGNINVNNAEFTNNTAVEYGGAIYGNSDGSITVSDSTFTGNKTTNTGEDIVSNGGAIASSGNLTATGSTFKDNHSTRDAGAINVGSSDKTVTASISNSTFENNIADWSGGAMSVGMNTTINNSNFKNNNADNGGALFVTRYNNPDTVLTINNTTFEGNTATNLVAQGNGGAISNNATVNINNSTFNGNSAVNNGGAIRNHTDGVLNISGTTFTNNTAKLGNDIYNQGEVNFVGSGETVINGGIAGTEASTINKKEEGTLTLKGDNKNYLGTTTITGGKIAYTKTNTDTYLGGTTNIEQNGTLEFNINENKEENVNGNIQGSGTFTKTGQGSVNLSNDNSNFSGTTQLNQGKIVFNKTADNDKYFSGTTKINNNATLEFNIAKDQNTQINGNIISTNPGSGNFIKSGQGSATLEGDNSAFSGNTTVQNGTLLYNINSNDDNFFSGSTNVQQSATIQVNTEQEGSINTTLSGNGSFIKTGNNTLNLEGNNSAFSGSVNINQGTLAFSSGNNKSFFGSKDINISGTDAINSALNYTFNENSTFDKNVLLNGFSALNFDTNYTVNINNSIVSNNTNNTANFNNGSYIFNTSLDNLAANINFNNTTIQIGDNISDFGNNSLNATANNSTLNLNNQKIDNLTFDNLTFSGDNTLNIDIDLAGRDDQANPSTTTDATYDKISADSGSGNITLNTIKIIQDGQWKDKELNLLSAGSADILLDNPRTEYTSNGYEYEITKSNNPGSVIINTTDYNIGEDTLKKAHIDANGKINRGFTVNNSSSTQNGTYKTLSDLETMGKGTFDVKGLNKENSTISANNLWTLFNIDSSDNEQRTLTINDVNIANATTDNNTRKDGAAVYISGQNATLETNNTAFTNNNAQNGGAIFNNNGNAGISNTTFNNNSAAQNGGAINSNGTTTVKTSTFNNNSAANGAAIAVTNGTANISGSTFNSNKATNNGGAVYNSGSNTTITDSTFTNNSANQGGAIYNDGTINIVSTSNDSYTSFNNNSNDIYTTGTVNFNGEGTTCVNSGIAGSNTAQIVKNDTGSLNLKGNNSSFSGKTTINNGSVVFDKTNTSDTYLGGVTEITENGTLEFKLSQNHTLNGTNNITGNGTLKKSGANDLNISGNNNTFTGTFEIAQNNVNYNQSTINGYFSGVTQIDKNASLTYTNENQDNINGLTGEGSFIKKGEGIANLSGDNSSFTGTANISEGSLSYNKTNQNENFIKGQTNISNNANLTFDLDYNETISGNITSADTTTINKKGPADLILADDNSSVNSTLSVDQGNVIYSITDEGDKYISGSTIINTGASLVFENDFDTTFTSKNNITGSGSWVINADGNKLTLNGENNNFKGTLDIQSGTASYEQSQNGSYVGGLTNINTGAALDFTNSADDYIHGISGASDSVFNKYGQGIAYLDSDNTSFDGSANIKEGTLSFVTNNSNDKFFSDSANVNISDNAQLNIDTNIDTSLGGNINSENFGDGTVSKTGDATLHITGDNSSFTGNFHIKEGTADYTQSDHSSYFGGNTTIDKNAALVYNNSLKQDTIKNLEGEGSFTKEGSQILNLEGDNSSFSGNVNINDGTLSFNDLNNKFFASEQINVNNAVLDYTANGTSVVNNRINLNGNAEFEIKGTGNNIININQSAATTNDNNTAAYSDATFVFNSSFDNFGTNGTGNSVSFNNADMQLGQNIENFGNNKLDAEFNNSTINMANNNTINNIVFNNLTLKDNVLFSIDLDLKKNPDQHEVEEEPEADMIKYNSGSGSISIENFVITQDGELRDVEVQVLDGNGITLNMDEQITAATSTEYIYSIKKSDVQGHENTHIQISTTDHIENPTENDFSLKNMHLRLTPDGEEISETRNFNVVGDAADYKVLSNLGTMAEGTFYVNGAHDENGDPTRAINGNNLWALFNADSSDPDDNGKRELNISGVKIYNATTENDTRDNGAAINIAGQNSNVNLEYSSLENNYAENAGAAVYNNGGTLIAQNTDFKNNKAENSGGAIYNKTGETTINGTDITSNSAQNAGAVYNEDTIKIENGNISNNKATNGQGGAIVNKGSATITTANINENTSTDNGGAIANTGSMTITNALVKDNISSANGGAIYNTGDLTLNNVSFDNNTSSSQGGAIYNNNGNLTISATNDKTVTLQNNKTAQTANDIYTNNGLTINTDGEKTAVNILSGISGSGTINKQGSGTFNITGNNSSYAGDAIVENGSIVYHKQTETDSYINGKTTLKQGTTLVYNLAANETLNGTIISEQEGTGTFIKTGDATLTITGDNSDFSGTTQIQKGTANYIQSQNNKYFSGNTQVYDNAKFVYTSNNDGTTNIETLKDFSTTGNGTGEFVKEGAGALNLTGSNSNFKGSASINEGSINYLQTNDSSYFGGKTNISENAKLQYTSNNNGTDNVETLASISGKGSLYKDGTGALKLSYNNSSFDGNIVIDEGKLIFNKIRNKDSYINGDTRINENGELEILLKRDDTIQSTITGNGTFTKSGDSVLTLANNNSSFNGTVNFNEGTMILSKEGKFFNAENFNISGSTTLDLRNSVMDTISLGNVNLLSGVSNLAIDVDLANNTGDFINANSVKGDGSLLIKDITVLSDTYYPGTTIPTIDTESGLSQKVSLDSSLSKVMGPIYQYEVTYDKLTGNLSFAGGDWGLMSYNPAVIMPQAAAQIGGYLTMLNTYEDVFANMDMLKLQQKTEREMFDHRNMYATTGTNLVYAPTMLPEEETGAWFRPFTSFESVPLKNGPTVSNVSYGALAGVDSELMHFKHGIDAVFSAYAGYNGSHQAALGSDIYQNGGVLGAMGVFYKGNFFTGITANAGASSADLTTNYGRDDLTLLMSGIASKSGYNWELLDSKLIIQPNYTMSYTFVNTFDYTNNMGVRISSDPIHAIQVAPGLKIIGNLPNGWQPYAGIAVVMNFLDESKFKADIVNLPQMSIKPYVTYNLGVQKRWGERFTGYIQTLFRTGGRNGVGFNLGLRWKI